MTGLTLEGLDGKLDGLGTKLDTFLASATKKAMTDEEHMKEEKEAAIKKANDEKEEEKKEAKRAALEAAIHKANDEEDPEKKDAAIKKAMTDYDENHKKEGKYSAVHEDEHMEEKEHMAQVASIITDKKIDIDNKILQAAALSNPAGLSALKAELEKGTFTASKKMYENMEKMFGKGIFQANIPKPTVTQPPPFFMAGAINPAGIDANQLNASSPVMDFAKLSTKDLMEGKTA